MLQGSARLATGLALASLLALIGGKAAHAQDALWRIAKVSGEAWVTSGGVQPASVSQQTEIRPGDAIRTGRNGRVLLVRGAESILVSANSAISLPEQGRPGLSTVIQQAGSILLDVEKRNVQHFEVETPFLAAVVKGTRFRVSIERDRAKVDVTRGQVQVSDFRSGQFALVLPGQTARASAGQVSGLLLSGSGALGRIEQGAPQAARVAPLAVPGGGLKPAVGAVPLLRGQAPAAVDPARGGRPTPGLDEASDRRRSPAAARISAPLGEVKLDIHKVTRGMARGESQANGQAASKATVWSTGELNPGNGGNKSVTGNNGAAIGVQAPASAGASSAASAAASGSVASVASSSNPGDSQGAAKSVASTGNGNGNSAGSSAGGNGKSNSSNSNAGGNGNGNAYGLAKGNGNSGNSNAGGNGNGNGKTKD